MNTIKLSNNRVLKIEQDTDGESPRNWDNLAKMIFFGRHSHLGDSHEINSRDYESFEEVEAAIKRKYNVACIKKIYGYSHSGLTIATTPFSCSWDSGVLGFAIITKEDLRENYSIKRVSKQYVTKGYEHIEGEVKTLDQYITGDVYGFTLEKDGEHEDSCWGFYGDNVLENGMLDHITEEVSEEIKKALAA